MTDFDPSESRPNGNKAPHAEINNIDHLKVGLEILHVEMINRGHPTIFVDRIFYHLFECIPLQCSRYNLLLAFVEYHHSLPNILHNLLFVLVSLSLCLRT